MSTSSTTTMSLLRRTTIRSTTHRLPHTLRPISTTPHLLSDPRPDTKDYLPPSNIPPSAQQAGKTKSPADDEQSSASKHPAPHSSDSHPAKQPDPQQEVERSTGFGNVEGGVPGGKEGLGYRSDKQG
ncbi:hypothetical protein Q7P37_010687 [Cladosporium fusiforme]